MSDPVLIRIPEIMVNRCYGCYYLAHLATFPQTCTDTKTRPCGYGSNSIFVEDTPEDLARVARLKLGV